MASKRKIKPSEPELVVPVVGPVEEKCGTCGLARTNRESGKLECHASGPQVFFRRFEMGLDHDGFWPVVPANEWCGKFKPKE